VKLKEKALPRFASHCRIIFDDPGGGETKRKSLATLRVATGFFHSIAYAGKPATL
jgi:hypothetical protein